MQQQQGASAAYFMPGLQYMHPQAIDIVNKTRPDTGR